MAISELSGDPVRVEVVTDEIQQLTGRLVVGPLSGVVAQQGVPLQIDGILSHTGKVSSELSIQRVSNSTN